VSDLHQWESADVIKHGHYLLKPFRVNGLGKMQSIRELLALPRISIPFHDVLPLLEHFHGVKLLKERQILQHEVVNTVCDKFLIRNDIRDLALLLANIYETVLAEDHDTRMVIWGILHLLIHQCGVNIRGSFEWDEDLVL
jgi:hypothetical protein